MEMNPYSQTEDIAFQRLIEGLQDEELFAHGTDLHFFSEVHEPDELKRHAEAYLGKKIDWQQFTFSCSC
jgi:hypothetical protein